MTVLHVDMAAFFAAVEQRDHPEWRGRPVIVGSGPHERGVVSTCSYEARKFGVRSAMPSRTAFEKCPHGIFVKPRMQAYHEVSKTAFEVFAKYSPFVEAVSVDEAFLDITGTAHLFGGMVPLAEKLRADVKAACGVTCSVGLAPNRLLAKLASEEKKPDGLFATPFEPQAIREFLAPKPLKILWGVGGKTAALLERYGYRTCADIQNADPRFLERILGESAAASIRSHAHGIDFSTVAHEEEEEKSISREHTFPEDETDREKVRATLLALVEDVGGRFRTERRWAHTAKLKLRDGMFNTITRQASFARPARDDMTFRHLILDIFDREWPEGTKRAVRLIGFGVTNFTSTTESAQPDLFGESSADDERMRKRERLAAALDAIRAKRNTKL
jgi:nucleotidyltransferase/DNA polymerase involved in DNA repair